MTTKDPCGSMETRQALRMEGESLAEMPHIRHASLSWRLTECRECSPRYELQSEQRATGRERETEREGEMEGYNSASPSWGTLEMTLRHRQVVNSRRPI